MKDLKNNIIGLTIGIRFNRSFRVPDISGNIIDNILYGDKTPFGTEFFPRIQEKSGREKYLFHTDDQGNIDRYLRINTDDLIFGFEINNNFEEKFDWLKNDIIDYFQNILFKDFKINNIRRIGIVFSHKVPKNEIVGEAISILTNNEIKDADNINISFSKKVPSEEALYHKNINDYKNVIFNLQEFEEIISAELDYQYYYTPEIEDLRECSADKVLEDAKIFMEKKFYKWLDKYENTTKDQ